MGKLTKEETSNKKVISLERVKELLLKSNEKENSSISDDLNLPTSTIMKILKRLLDNKYDENKNKNIIIINASIFEIFENVPIINFLKIIINDACENLNNNSDSQNELEVIRKDYFNFITNKLEKSIDYKINEKCEENIKMPILHISRFCCFLRESLKNEDFKKVGICRLIDFIYDLLFLISYYRIKIILLKLLNERIKTTKNYIEQFFLKEKLKLETYELIIFSVFLINLYLYLVDLLLSKIKILINIYRIKIILLKLLNERMKTTKNYIEQFFLKEKPKLENYELIIFSASLINLYLYLVDLLFSKIKILISIYRIKIILLNLLNERIKATKNYIEQFFLKEKPKLENYELIIFSAFLINLYLYLVDHPGGGKNSNEDVLSGFLRKMLFINYLISIEIRGPLYLYNEEIEYYKGLFNKSEVVRYFYYSDEMNLSPVPNRNIFHIF